MLMAAPSTTAPGGSWVLTATETQILSSNSKLFSDTNSGASLVRKLNALDTDSDGESGEDIIRQRAAAARRRIEAYQVSLRYF